MKENEKLELNKKEYDNDARAVNESELLPIFEAMEFSGDIQPLEDFEIPEPALADLQPKKKSELKETDRAPYLKKKKMPIVSDSNKLKKLLITLPIVLVLIGLTAFGVKFIADSGKNTAPVRTIYSSDRLTYINLDNDKTYEIIDAQNIKVSKDGMRVFYCKNTTSRTGKYDIRFVNIGKTSSMKREGSIICIGVDDGWTVNADGSLLCYSVTTSGVKQFYVYSAESGKSEPLANGIDEVFLPSTGDVIYFTRRNGSIYSLHRMRYGENSQNVASELEYVKGYGSDDGFEIIYTVKTGNEDNIDVYSVKNLDMPVQICDDVSEVYLNDYVYGGNLYYFKKKAANINWEDFIKDPYAENDMKLQRPVESDYMIEYGFIFKRYVLDKSAYEAAKAKYQAKLKRDAIRDELNKIDFGLAVEDEYTCYFYNDYANKVLATGITLKNVLSFNTSDAPGIIFRKSVVNVDKMLSMDELVSIAAKSDETAATDYVREKVEDSYELSDTCLYVWYDGSNVISHTIDNYKSRVSQFFPVSRHLIYAFSNSNIYPNTITQDEFKIGWPVAKGVIDCEVNGNFVYYKKPVTADSSSLYRYSPDTGEQYICDNVYSYAVLENDVVIVFSTEEADASSAVVGVYNNGEYTQVDTGVSMGHFVYNKNSFAYIRNVGNSDVTNAGEMCVYVVGNDTVSYQNDVTDIVYLKNDLEYQKLQKH